VLDRLRAFAPAPVAKIAVVAPGGSELVDFDQLYYVQADGDYCRVHTYDRSYLSTASLGELAARLGPGFARIHRSYLVNLAKVSGVRRSGQDRIRLQLDDAARTELDVARRQGRELRERLGL
jgi:DNA-binding LytR/AlgR family response regulator